MIPNRNNYLVINFTILLLTSWINIYGQDSRNGYWFPPKDTLRIFLIYAELVNDPDDPGTIRGWKAGTIPPDPGYLFDHRLLHGDEPRGIITKYYYQASFGKYIVLADYYPEIVSIDYTSAKGRGIDQVLNIVANSDTEDIITAHGYSLNKGDFDFLRTSSWGEPKKTEPDSLIDIVMVVWRVNSRMTTDHSAGYCVPGKKMYRMKGMKGMNSYSSIMNKNYTKPSIIRHEFSHLLLGGNNFHTGGAGAGTKTFMSDVGGYAMLSTYLRSSPVYCSFDRRRLGWKHPDNQFQISARDPATGWEIGADLTYRQQFTHGSNEFILRDFVETGDAIRIELPYLKTYSEKINRQWLWLENHQKAEGNIDHDKATGRGLYAYIQIGKETLNGPDTFSGNCNYTWPVSAFGNHDFQLDEETMEYMVSRDLSNPFTGYNNLILGVYDLKEKDELIYRNEVFMANNLKIDGKYPDSSVFNYNTYPLFGTSMDAFLPGNKIGIDRNPAAVPVLTYQTSASVRARPRLPVPSDNRMIHLNGISVEFLEQLPDGSIKLRIRWDDNKLGKIVRWCGDIHLHEELLLEKKAGILLDQGLTPTRSMNPVRINSENIFADTTVLTLNDSAGIIMKKRSRLVLNNKSSLVLKEGSWISLERKTKIIISDSSRLIIHPKAMIIGHGKIILSGGASLEMPENSIKVKVKSRRN